MEIILPEGTALIGVHESFISVALQTLPHNYTFIEKSGYPFLSLNPLALPCQKGSVSAIALRTLFSEFFPVLPGEGEESHQIATLCAFSPDNASEIPIFGA